MQNCRILAGCPAGAHKSKQKGVAMGIDRHIMRISRNNPVDQKKDYIMKKSLRQKRIAQQNRRQILGAIGIFLACTPIMAAAYMYGSIIGGV